MEVLHFLLSALGSKGIPFVTASATYAVFRLLEGHASKEAKVALTNWLLSLDLRKADSLPQGVRDIFIRIFGSQHFSLLCFRRSVYYSIAAVLFTALIYLLLHPDSAFRTEQREFQSLFYRIAGAWIFVSLFYDYLNLLKTRIILGFLAAKVRRKAAVLGVVILDPLLGYVLFAAIFSIFGLLVAILSYPDRTAEFLAEARIYPEHDLQLLLPVIQWQKNVSPLFYAGMLPSIWLWVFTAALFAARFLVRVEPVFKFLLFFLDIKKRPIREVGFIAAALAFAASAALLGLVAAFRACCS